MNCKDCLHFGTLKNFKGLYCAIKGMLEKIKEDCGDLRQSEVSKIIHEMDKEIRIKNLSKTKKLLQY